MMRHAVIPFVTLSALTLGANVATAQQPFLVVDPWSPDAAVGWRAPVVTDLIDPWAESDGSVQMVIVDPWKARPEDSPKASFSPVDVIDPWAYAAVPTAQRPNSGPESPR